MRGATCPQLDADAIGVLSTVAVVTVVPWVAIAVRGASYRTLHPALVWTGTIIAVVAVWLAAVAHACDRDNAHIQGRMETSLLLSTAGLRHMPIQDALVTMQGIQQAAPTALSTGTFFDSYSRVSLVLSVHPSSATSVFATDSMTDTRHHLGITILGPHARTAQQDADVRVSVSAHVSQMIPPFVDCEAYDREAPAVCANHECGTGGALDGACLRTCAGGENATAASLYARQYCMQPSGDAPHVVEFDIKGCVLPGLHVPHPYGLRNMSRVHGERLLLHRQPWYTAGDTGHTLRVTDPYMLAHSYGTGFAVIANTKTPSYEQKLYVEHSYLDVSSFLASVIADDASSGGFAFLVHAATGTVVASSMMGDLAADAWGPGPVQNTSIVTVTSVTRADSRIRRAWNAVLSAVGADVSALGIDSRHILRDSYGFHAACRSDVASMPHVLVFSIPYDAKEHGQQSGTLMLIVLAVGMTMLATAAISAVMYFTTFAQLDQLSIRMRLFSVTQYAQMPPKASPVAEVRALQRAFSVIASTIDECRDFLPDSVFARLVGGDADALDTDADRDETSSCCSTEQESVDGDEQVPSEPKSSAVQDSFGTSVSLIDCASPQHRGSRDDVYATSAVLYASSSCSASPAHHRHSSACTVTSLSDPAMSLSNSAPSTAPDSSIVSANPLAAPNTPGDMMFKRVRDLRVETSAHRIAGSTESPAGSEAGCLTSKSAATPFDREGPRMRHTRDSSEASLIKLTSGMRDASLVERKVTLIVVEVCGLYDMARTKPTGLVGSHAKLMAHILFSARGNKGMMDGFSGDEVHVGFNTQRVTPNHRMRAVTCAMLLGEVQGIGRDGLSVVCGLSSGKAKVGIMGCQGTKNFNIVGNVAGRARFYATLASSWQINVMAGDCVVRDVRAAFESRRCHQVETVTGKVVWVNEVLFELENGPPQEWMYELEQQKDAPFRVVDAAVAAVFHGDLKEAAALLRTRPIASCHPTHAVMPHARALGAWVSALVAEGAEPRPLRIVPGKELARTCPYLRRPDGSPVAAARTGSQCTTSTLTLPLHEENSSSTSPSLANVMCLSPASTLLSCSPQAPRLSQATALHVRTSSVQARPHHGSASSPQGSLVWHRSSDIMTDPSSGLSTPSNGR